MNASRPIPQDRFLALATVYLPPISTTVAVTQPSALTKSDARAAVCVS